MSLKLSDNILINYSYLQIQILSNDEYNYSKILSLS